MNCLECDKADCTLVECARLAPNDCAWAKLPKFIIWHRPKKLKLAIANLACGNRAPNLGSLTQERDVDLLRRFHERGLT